MIFRSLFKCFTLISCLCLTAFPSSARSEATNLLSLLEGCLPVIIPATYDGWDAYNLLDDSPSTGWANETGKTQNNIFVFEMAAGWTLESFEFDTAGADSEGAAAKDILVEVSNESASGGFARVLQATFANSIDGQKFKAEKLLPGQWVRLTIKTNYGNAEYTEIFGVRGYGSRPEPGKSPDISGTYSKTIRISMSVNRALHWQDATNLMMDC